MLCSPTVDNFINWCDIRYEYVTSDHKPLALSFLNLHTDTVPIIMHDDKEKRVVYDWPRADEPLCVYRYELDEALKSINIPAWCYDVDTSSACGDSVTKYIGGYYNAVIKSIHSACAKAIPCRTQLSNYSEYIVPGWNEYVSDNHELARNAYLDWLCCGKPRFGPSYLHMSKTRAQFKLALRYCKQHEDMMRADSLANSLSHCSEMTILSSGKTFVNIITIKLKNLLMLLMNVWATKILLNVGEHTWKSCITVIMTVSGNSETALLLLLTLVLLCNIS